MTRIFSTLTSFLLLASAAWAGDTNGNPHDVSVTDAVWVSNTLWTPVWRVTPTSLISGSAGMIVSNISGTLCNYVVVSDTFNVAGSSTACQFVPAK